jgi:long-chain acyl-CoA synthetase
LTIHKALARSASAEKVWLKNYPQGVHPEIDLSRYKNIMGVFDEAVQKHRSKVAYTNMNFDLSFEELDQKVGQLASFFQNELQLKKGDRIAIQMPNLLQFPVALFAALRVGLVVVIIGVSPGRLATGQTLRR